MGKRFFANEVTQNWLMKRNSSTFFYMNLYVIGSYLAINTIKGSVEKDMYNYIFKILDFYSNY
jgi:hypothetical protein